MPANFFNDPATATLNGSLTIAADHRTGDNGTLTVVNVIATRVSGGVLNAGAASLAQSIATSPANTITTAGGRIARITGAGIATCALQTGTVDGQEITIINVGAASTCTVNVGANVAIASGVGARFTWDAGTTLWYSK